jgi:hypothetical protein
VPKYGITHMPYYDLQTGELFHKEWNAVMDITFAWNWYEERYYVKTRKEVDK